MPEWKIHPDNYEEHISIWSHVRINLVLGYAFPMSGPLVHLDSTSSVCLSPKPLTPCVTQGDTWTFVWRTYPLRHHKSTSNPCARPTFPLPHMLRRQNHNFLCSFPLKEWTAYQSPSAGNDETDWQKRVAWKCEFFQRLYVRCVEIYIWNAPLVKQLNCW